MTFQPLSRAIAKLRNGLWPIIKEKPLNLARAASACLSLPLLCRVLAEFRKGIFRITKEKWIDLAGACIALLYRHSLFNSGTTWETAAVGTWILCFVVEVQFITAAFKVWHEIGSQPEVRNEVSAILLPNARPINTQVSVPRPKYFQLKLIGIPVLSLAPLFLVCFLVMRLAVASERTYAYLVPTGELMECQRRAFFLRTVGPQILHNVRVELREDKSGRTVSEAYPELDPGRQLSEKYFWFTPSTPWEEQYTINIAARESQSSQILIVGSSQKELHFATQVRYDNGPEPIASCRDKSLPESYKLAFGDQHSCSELLALEGDLPGKLDVPSYQTADGNFAIRRIKELPSPSVLDAESDDRQVTEYQHQIIEPILKKYTKSKIHIYYAGGEKTLAYAKEFQKIFSDNGWAVSGPSPVPAGDERAVDLQLSVNYHENWNRLNPKSQELMEAFKRAGIKRHSRVFADPDVPSNTFVLWVGPRSPSAVSPDQCLPAEIKPANGRPHTCEMVQQIDSGYCPFVPK